MCPDSVQQQKLDSVAHRACEELGLDPSQLPRSVAHLIRINARFTQKCSLCRFYALRDELPAPRLYGSRRKWLSMARKKYDSLYYSAREAKKRFKGALKGCLLYTSDAAAESRGVTTAGSH